MPCPAVVTVPVALPAAVAPVAGQARPTGEPDGGRRPFTVVEATISELRTAMEQRRVTSRAIVEPQLDISDEMDVRTPDGDGAVRLRPQRSCRGRQRPRAGLPRRLRSQAVTLRRQLNGPGLQRAPSARAGLRLRASHEAARPPARDAVARHGLMPRGSPRAATLQARRVPTRKSFSRVMPAGATFPLTTFGRPFERCDRQPWRCVPERRRLAESVATKVMTLRSCISRAASPPRSPRTSKKRGLYSGRGRETTAPIDP